MSQQGAPEPSNPLMWGLHHASSQGSLGRASISSASGSPSRPFVDGRSTLDDRQGSSSSLTLPDPHQPSLNSRSRSPSATTDARGGAARPAQPHVTHTQRQSHSGSWTQFSMNPQQTSNANVPASHGSQNHARLPYASHPSALPNPHSTPASPAMALYPPARSPSAASNMSAHSTASQAPASYPHPHSYSGPTMPSPQAWTPPAHSGRSGSSDGPGPPPGQAWHPFAAAPVTPYPPLGPQAPAHHALPSSYSVPLQHPMSRPDALQAGALARGANMPGPPPPLSSPGSASQQIRRPSSVAGWQSFGSQVGSEARVANELGSINPGQPGRPVQHDRTRSAQAADHDATTCEGCQADLRAALEASRLSAEEEARRRAAGSAGQERLSAEEMAHINAMELSAAEERARAEADEAALLQAVMEASLKDEEVAIRSRREREEQQAREALMLQQSRDDEAERARRTSEAERRLLERSKREAEEEKERRSREEQEAREIEESVLRQSRLEMEQEWSRRDEEERALSNFLSQGGQPGDAAYWRHLHQDQAYQLAVRMQPDHRPHADTSAPPLPPLPSGPSSPSSPSASGAARRPLPRVPPMTGAVTGASVLSEGASLDHAATHTLAQESHYDDREEDPFADEAEAPPLYDEVGSDRPPNAPDSVPSHIRFEAHPALLAAAASQSSSSQPSAAGSQQTWPSEKQQALATQRAAQSSVGHGAAASYEAGSAQQGEATGTSTSSSSAADPATRPIEIGSFDDAIREEDEPDADSNPLLSVLRDHRRSVSSVASPRSGAAHTRTGSAGSATRQRPAFRPADSTSSSSLKATEILGQAQGRARASSTQSVASSVSSAARDGRPDAARARQQSNASTRTQEATPSSQPSTPHAPSASTSATSLDEPATTRPTSHRGDFSQTTMTGTDWGYALEPFAPELYASPANESASDGKARFPNTVQLSMAPPDGSGLREGSHRSSFFTIRAPSWKGLLRAMAWYGNTLITAGPQEIADAALASEQAGSQRSEAGTLSLALQIEVVTPTRLRESGYGLGTASTGARAPLVPGSVPFAATAAHVAICLSLAPANSGRGSPEQGDLASALKASSRSLDVSYLRRGSARRVIQLPREAPRLPFTMVQLAQHVHAAHRFSAACPTSSNAALHSPRDLHHAIEAHDVDYVRRIMKQNRASNGGVKIQAGTPEHQTIGLDGIPVGLANEAGELRDFAAADEEDEHGRVGRLAARVKRRLAKRAGDGRVVDDQLMSWVTPLVTEDAVQQEDAWEERK